MMYRNAKFLLIAILFTSLTWADDSLDGETFAAMDDLFFEPMMEMPEVLTAARLRQSQLDTPASVTVIEADTIAALGFKDIEEIFRLVPGMMVGYHSNYGEKTPSVAYHGTNASDHRRLQVLVDGRSLFKPGLARVDWVDIPLAIEDIARIEVIRGPNSAAYGANSYLGTINILTKHPSDTQGRIIKFTAGNRSVVNTYLNVSDRFMNSDFRYTLGSKKKSGFDYIQSGDEKIDNRDGSEGIYAMLKTFTSFSTTSSMEWQAGYKRGVNEQKQTVSEDIVLNLSEQDILAEDSFLWARFNKDFSTNQSGQVQVYSEQFNRTAEWIGCIKPQAQAVLGVDLVEPCGQLNQNVVERKSEFEYQHTSTWFSDFRTVAGFRYRLDQFDTATYNGGYTENKNSSAFFNAEYKFDDLVTANWGGMYEYDELNGKDYSPRYALNMHLNQNHTVRFIYSRAIRSPDIYEKSGRIVYNLAGSSVNGAGDDPFIFGLNLYGEGRRFATGEVENERIHSHEISYFGILRDLGIQVDIKFFYDELSGLISQSLDHEANKPLGSDNRIHQRGFEGQVKWDINRDNQLMMSFSKIDTKDNLAENNSAVDRERSLTAEKSGSLSWIKTLPKESTLGVAYYYLDGWNVPRRPEQNGYDFQRLDLTLSREIKLPNDHSLTLKGTIQYRLDDDPLLYESNNYDDKEHYYFSAQLNF